MRKNIPKISSNAHSILIFWISENPSLFCSPVKLKGPISRRCYDLNYKSVVWFTQRRTVKFWCLNANPCTKFDVKLGIRFLNLKRSGYNVRDNMLYYQSRDRRINAPLLQSSNETLNPDQIPSPNELTVDGTLNPETFTHWITKSKHLLLYRLC